MAENTATPESRNLDSLLEGCPTHKRTIVRLLWTKIRAPLDRGHTVREIREKLRFDGTDVGYQACAGTSHSAARPTPASNRGRNGGGKTGAGPDSGGEIRGRTRRPMSAG